LSREIVGRYWSFVVRFGYTIICFSAVVHYGMASLPSRICVCSEGLRFKIRLFHDVINIYVVWKLVTKRSAFYTLLVSSHSCVAGNVVVR
jgi:hypothetical protein